MDTIVLLRADRHKTSFLIAPYRGRIVCVDPDGYPRQMQLQESMLKEHPYDLSACPSTAASGIKQGNSGCSPRTPDGPDHKARLPDDLVPVILDSEYRHVRVIQLLSCSACPAVHFVRRSSGNNLR